MVPLYLRNIPVELYGAWLASGNILNWILVVDPGISTVLIQRVSKSYGANQRSLVGKYALGGILITCLITLVVLLGGIICSMHIASWINLANLDLSEELRANFFLAVIASSITLLAYTVGAINLGLQASFSHGLNYLIANTLSLISTAVLLILGYGLMSISIGLLVRSIIFFGGGLGFMLWHFRKGSIRLVFCNKRIGEIFRLMSFTSLGRVGSILSVNMDAFIIARFLGPEIVPVFALSRRGLSIAELLLNRSGNAISPSLSHLSGEGHVDKIRGIIVRLLGLNFWILGLAFGGFLALNDDFIRIWVGSEFFVGKTISYLFCVLLLFKVIFSLMHTLCVALGDIEHSSVVQLFQSLVTFFSLLAGVYYMGLIGGVIAPLLGFSTIALCYYPRLLGRLAALRKSDWKLLAREGAVSLTLSLCAFILFIKIELAAWWSFILICCALSGFYTVLLTLLSSEAKNELLGFIRWLQSKLRISRSRKV